MNETAKQEDDCVIVGAGFTGLAAGYALARRGRRVRVLEADDRPGGLAGAFQFEDGVWLEKFYHHWFNHDDYALDLVRELGLQDDLLALPSKTGMYFNGRIWRLSGPLDLLRFRALSLTDRVRLGLLLLRARRVKDWKTIEHLSIREWLEPLCGKAAYKVVWAPLVQAKFSGFAERVSAVWMWKKLVLRGGTRNRRGGEELRYLRGGFGRLAEALARAIRERGGAVDYGRRVTAVEAEGGRITGLLTERGPARARDYIFTPSFALIADLLQTAADGAADGVTERGGMNINKWLQNLRRVRYLGNICLVLRLRRSLSQTYWLNVNDPGFPFVGVIEHTNFDSPDNYKGTRIAYLSRYLAAEDPLWEYSDEAYFRFALSHLRRMFPRLEESWIVNYKVWRADYAQPVTERNYSSYVPGRETPFRNGFISTMAHVYPEDRGTNYAIREGRRIAELVCNTSAVDGNETE